MLIALSLTVINKPQARTFSWLFHGHQMHLLWAFLQTDRIPSPFIYFNLWKSRPNFAYIWSLKKVYPSQAESPHIGPYMMALMLQIKKLADFRRFGCLREHLVIRLCLVTLSRLNTLRHLLFILNKISKFELAFLLLEY